MKTVAIIQARMESTRLPGKVLADIAGKPMLERVVERTRRASRVDQVVVATSDSPADEVLVALCQRRGWAVVAGSQHDVLARYRQAAEAYQADQIVRITSDCPLIDPGLVDAVVALSDRPGFEYGCNFHPCRRFPRGLDCEVMTRGTLERIDRLATAPRFREHVTLLVYDPQGQGRFRIDHHLGSTDWSWLRWTVDTAEDLELVRAIYGHFGDRPFSWRELLDVYPQYPHWRRINLGTVQKVA